MKFHSTNSKSRGFSFKQAVRLGLAPDGGLFMPDAFPKLPPDFFKKIDNLSLHQIAVQAASKFALGIPQKNLRTIIRSALNFEIPLKKLADGIYLLELFHGPTMAFKDVGARFLARSLRYLLRNNHQTLNIIVATSGDTGSAVASGFFKVPNIEVYILYPSGKVSPLQEKQLTTYGGNITALEVKGTFDDCQKLAKQVLADKKLNKIMQFSSANSINFGRLLPQSFYYFWAVAQLQKLGINEFPAIVVPSGNVGNLFAGLMAKKMGLPVKGFVAACNSNDILPKYLETGKFLPKRSKKTISNAMDVGNPSNFARMLELYKNSYKKMSRDITGYSISDQATRQTIRQVYQKTGYILDPHTAVGVAAALRYQKQDKNHPIIVLSTAHPAKFKGIVEPIIKKHLPLPKQLQAAMGKKKKSIVINPTLDSLKKTLF